MPNESIEDALKKSASNIKKYTLKVVLTGTFIIVFSLFGTLFHLFNSNKALCSHHDAETYVYHKLDTNEIVKFDTYSKLMYSHWVEGLFICSDEYAYKCIIGENNGFVFAVPRVWGFVTYQWEFSDSRYHIEGESLFISGTEVYKIYLASENQDKQIWYYYSRTKGLIAFGMTEQNHANVGYILESECGILAN